MATTKVTITAKDAKIIRKAIDKALDKNSSQKEEFIGTGNGKSLRSRTGTWFECKVAYEKTMENGADKMVNESYVVDALSFTEAEARIIEEMDAYVSGELRIADISKARYGDIFFSNVEEDDLWFKARLAFIRIDEKSEKEKRSYVNYLVQAKSLERARRYVDEVMGKTMIDYELKSLSETKILDVFEHHAKTEESKEEAKPKQDVEEPTVGPGTC